MVIRRVLSKIFDIKISSKSFEKKLKEENFLLKEQNTILYEKCYEATSIVNIVRNAVKI